MRKILGLLFISSSIFSMQLDLVKPNKTVSVLVPADKLTPAELNSLSKVYINRKAVFAPERLGSVELCHGKKGFSVLQNNKKHAIAKYFIDPLLRDITREQLGAFLQGGYLSINQMNDGEFSLKANGRIKGGGPAFGAFMYWATKSLCYGTAAAVITTTVAVTGGAVVGAAGGGAVAGAATGAVAANSASLAIAGVAATSTAGTVIGTTSGAVVGTLAAGGVVAGGTGAVAAVITATSTAGATIGGVAVAEAAALTTVAGLTAVSGTTTAASVGTVTATVMAVESLSVAVGTFFGMLPTP